LPRNKDFTLISVGFQEKRKNTILLLKALSLLEERRINVRTIIVGDGPEMAPLKKYTQNKNLKTVYFLGNLAQHETFLHLKTSSLFIHCSYSDSWPQVYNEAAYCSLPILISDRAGVNNEYTNKYNDLVLFDPFNEEDLARKIEFLIGHREVLEELGRFSYEDIVKNDGQKVMASFMELVK